VIQEEQSSAEFSRIVDLNSFKNKPLSLSLEADRSELRNLANRFKLVSISALSANIYMSWLDVGNVLLVEGSFSASVFQQCVVTLEPVEEEINEKMNLTFARETEKPVEVIELDDSELLTGDVIDVGEIISEELSLSLNPYPRSPNLDMSEMEIGPGAILVGEDKQNTKLSVNNPFSTLAKLKPKL